MAQLSDDCFAFGGDLLTVASALAQIQARVAPIVETEMVPLQAAAGRILAHDIIAAMNLPPHDNSAVDGYAVAHADLTTDRDTLMPVTGRAAAGHPLDRPMRRGESIRIFTGAPLPQGAVYDANRFMLAALLAGFGCVVTDFGIRPDSEAVLIDTLAAASAEHDLIVTSGGVSTGEEDHVKSAVEKLGTLHFWRLAIKPGRPVALGQIDGVPLIGLPGNPVAVIVTFLVLARPLIAKLAGASVSEPRLFPVRAGFGYRKKPGRREYLRANLARTDGAAVAVKYPKDGAGILSSIVRSDGLVILDEMVSELTVGTMVDFLPFSEVIG